MARPLRIELPGALYHVMSRGNERNRIVRDDADREYLGSNALKRIEGGSATLKQAVRKLARTIR